VGKYEVTFAEWDACVADGGCEHKPDDQGWGRDDRPVINVTWHDAQEYVSWIGRTTETSYRLLSEAEWEYVARAGSSTAYWWGQDLGRNNANCDGCGSQWDNAQTAPVGSFDANDFGLHDTAGNVLEWTEDCWQGNYQGAPAGYQGAPADGSAWTTGGNCVGRVLRGGSWNHSPEAVRSAYRIWFLPGSRVTGTYGFRVARPIN
jgi:formylglycine-generating enzyme required for sulfatase activity